MRTMTSMLQLFSSVNFSSFRYASIAFLKFALLISLAIHSAFSFAEWKAKKTSFGDPDLQGVWRSATITALERDASFGTSLVVNAEQAQAIEKSYYFNVASEEDAKPTDPNQGAPTDGDSNAGYNAFWLDPGKQLMQVRGEYRTSIVIDPANGKVPYTPAAMRAFMEYGRGRSMDGPETRSLGERCLVGFGSSGGPPMLPVVYNNHYQIVQSPGHVMIMAEMNHDARIVRLKDKHNPNHMKKWLGDSVGHWDGDTLVVETINQHPQQSFRFAIKHRLYLPPTAKVTERFTRVAEDEIVYQFTVEDKEAFSQAWTGEMALRPSSGQIYEYACHEGNYSLPGILAGARREESLAK